LEHYKITITLGSTLSLVLLLLISEIYYDYLSGDLDFEQLSSSTLRLSYFFIHSLSFPNLANYLFGDTCGDFEVVLSLFDEYSS
jgi:hypothetical protein